jgi:hypothetical protein
MRVVGGQSTFGVCGAEVWQRWAVLVMQWSWWLVIRVAVEWLRWWGKVPVWRRWRWVGVEVGLPLA